MPINSWVATLFIGVVFINGLISGAIFRNYKNFFKPLPLIFSSLYLMHLVGLIYTSNMHEGLADIETKLSLLIFPFILFTMPIRSKHKKFILIRRFILGCVVASLFCLLSSAYLYYTTGQNTFYYKALSGHLGFNPAYFSMYLGFAVFAILFSLVANWKTYSLPKRSLEIGLVVFFMLIVLLLSARTILFSLVLLLSVAFVIYMYHEKKLVKGFGILTVGLLVISALAWSLPKTQLRIKTAFNSFVEPPSDKNKPNIRIRIWNAAAEIISDNDLIFGNGTGDIQDKLLAIYKKKDYKVAEEKNLNTHNQYLQTVLGLGLLGLLLLLGNLVLPMIIGMQHEHYLYVFFLLLFSAGMLTESMLELQQGVMFYAFFNSLFASFMISKKE